MVIETLENKIFTRLWRFTFQNFTKINKFKYVLYSIDFRFTSLEDKTFLKNFNLLFIEIPNWIT